VRNLPDTIVTKKDGLYCFESEETAEQFKRIADRDKIPYQIAHNSASVANWIDLSKCDVILRVPEHAFNPAQLTGRFAQTCLDLGGQVVTGQGVKSIIRNADKLILTLDSGETLSADSIINSLSRWSSTIEVPQKAPKLDIRWFRWRLLCLHSAVINDLPNLQEVIMIIDNHDKMPSVIPHEKWMTLDFKATPVEQVFSAEAIDAENWRLFDTSNENDRINYSVVQEAFKPLQYLDQKTIKNNLYSLAGIHGRRQNAPTGSQNHVDVSDEFSDYFVAFGGQASTGFLDAIDIIEYFRSYYKLNPKNRVQLSSEFIQYLSPHPIQGYSPMRWESQR
jgi:hypothetical protein